jgi:hypothetical protein
VFTVPTITSTPTPPAAVPDRTCTQTCEQVFMQ